MLREVGAGTTRGRDMRIVVTFIVSVIISITQDFEGKCFVLFIRLHAVK